MSQQTTDIDYDALAKQASATSTPASSAPATGGEIDYDALARQASGASDDFDSPAPYTDVLGGIKGIGEGAYKGMQGLAAIAAQHGLHDPSDPLSAEQRAQQLTQGSQTLPLGAPGHELEALGQKAGSALPDLVAWYFGDLAVGKAGEALKGTELGDRLVHMAKVASHYEQSSAFVKGLMDRGLQMARQMTVGAGLGGLQGGAKGAAVGATLGAIPAIGEEAVGAAGKVIRGLRDVPQAGMPPGPWIEDTVQADAHAGHEQIADNIAKDLGIQRRTLGDPTDPRSPTALRNIYDSLSDQVELEAKGKFKPLDDATDGEFTKLAKALKDNAVKMQKAVDPAVEARLDEEAAGLRVRLDEATELAKQKSVDPKLADEGNALWRKKSALADVDAKVKIAMGGKEQATKPTLNTGKLANSMQTLFDSRRLDDISPQRADDLYRQALESARQEELTRAAAKSREEAIGEAQKIRAEAQTKVEQRRERLKTRALITGAGLVGGAAAVKGVQAVSGLTQ